MTQRDMLIDALREKGLMGCDEDMGIEEGEEHAESHDWSAELCAARADGLIDDLGCSFIRLSRAWWVAEIQRTMTNVWEEQARTIVDMLAGDGALEAEPRAKHEPAPRPPAVVLRATVPYAAVKPAATGPQPDSPGDLAGIAWAMANLGASSEAQQRVLQGFPQFAVTLHVRADGLVTVAGARFLGECGAVPSSEPKTRCELDELHDGRHVASIEHGVVSWPRRWDFAADREGEPEAQR